MGFEFWYGFAVGFLFTAIMIAMHDHLNGKGVYIKKES